MLRELLRVSVDVQDMARDLGWSAENLHELNEVLVRKLVKGAPPPRPAKRVFASYDELLEVGHIAMLQVQKEFVGVPLDTLDIQTAYGRHRVQEMTRRGYRLSNTGGWYR